MTPVYGKDNEPNRLGKEFMAHGFPEDVLGPNQGQPTARLFRGYFQRYMTHRSHMGYSYAAGELNIPCPGGLSGGPLFRPDDPNAIIGLVTENIETATVLEEEQIKTSAGTVVRTDSYRRVINYGVALLLSSIWDWLDEEIAWPPAGYTR